MSSSDDSDSPPSTTAAVVLKREKKKKKKLSADIEKKKTKDSQHKGKGGKKVAEYVASVPLQFHLQSGGGEGLPSWLANPISISPHIQETQENAVTHPQWRLSLGMQKRLLAAGISVNATPSLSLSLPISP